MNPFRFIENRVVLSDDNDFRRSQKLISIYVLSIGSLFSLVNAYTYPLSGLDTVGEIYLVWAILVLAAALLILAKPGLWLPTITVMITAVIPLTLATHVYSGGFQSGLATAIWLLQVPIGAALLVGFRFTVLSLFLYIVGVVLAEILEPFAATLIPDLDLGTRQQISAANMIMLGIIASSAILYLLQQLDYYRNRADRLLLNILPATIARRLQETDGVIADGYPSATVLFADIVGSTQLFSNLDPVEVVDWLNDIFTRIDQLVDKYQLEKIRTIGDSYMVASGVPTKRFDHAQSMALFALDLVDELRQLRNRYGLQLSFRIGINSGPLVAGIIGRSKFQYDIWGDTVNIASRMESHGVPGKVQISSATYSLIADDFECKPRGSISVKGKGDMETWFLEGKKQLPG
jgi:class 3 adenylate cyclase